MKLFLTALSAAIVLIAASLPSASQERLASNKTEVPFMFGLFNAQKPKLEPLTEEQLVHEDKWAKLSDSKKYRVKDEYEPTIVEFRGYKPGTIVVDTEKKELYFVESPVRAVRYRIAVGQDGLQYKGKLNVGEKKVWPRWTPTNSMIERNPGRYKRYSGGMDGGPKNPLGARAIYLHLGRQDTMLRIHGTNAPNTIGTASSNGCYRMHNEHVIDLYKRVKVGAEVVIL